MVDLSTGRVLGMEALVRWEHPTHGLISPARLLPHAEVSGDIGPLTRWILMEACSKACNWSPSIQLGVNCTIHQLRRGEVSAAVVLALEETGFNSGQLTLEVTEDAIVDSAASADLRTLSAMGVQLSVDDVGTNWSSFEPFKRNSISSVKIDGSFIAGLESTQGINRLVVETVIHMAHSLGMSTIVEWVETAVTSRDRAGLQRRRRPGLLLFAADVERGRHRLRLRPGDPPLLAHRPADVAHPPGRGCHRGDRRRRRPARRRGRRGGGRGSRATWTGGPRTSMTWPRTRLDVDDVGPRRCGRMPMRLATASRRRRARSPPRTAADGPEERTRRGPRDRMAPSSSPHRTWPEPTGERESLVGRAPSG